MAMRTYVVTREGATPHNRGTVKCRVQYPAGDGQELHHVKLHSPDGFEYGYEGSGPGDLALSILAEQFHEHDAQVNAGENSDAWKFHHPFKRAFIAPVPEAVHRFEITEDEVAAWVGLRKLIDALKTIRGVDQERLGEREAKLVAGMTAALGEYEAGKARMPLRP